MWKMIVKAASATWKGLDFLRRTFANLLAVAIVVALVVALGSGRTTKVEPHSILFIPISGSVVERAKLPNRETALAMVVSGEQQQTCLHDVLDAFELAAKDEAIDGVLLKVDDLRKVGLASAREIGEAMDKFRKSGKKITVWASSYTQAQYAIASHASEVFLHPMGSVLLTGLGSSRLYWGETLRRAGVKVHVFKAGAYKSFPEIFVRQGPSEEALKADRYWMEDAWKRLALSMQSARGLMPERVDRLIAEYPEVLEKNAGDWSAVALDSNLIDGVRNYDAVRKLLLDRQGAKPDAQLRSIHYLDYLDDRMPDAGDQPGVAMLVLEGEIHDAKADAGRISASNAIRLIEEVEKDKSARALVVRINSPGGAALASEKIRHALERVKKAGKPVVISMGDMAASGGYWLSLGASKIVADPLTLTGSIGVFGMLPTFEETLSKFGVGVGGASTGWIAAAKDPMHSIDPRYEKLLTLSVERTYRDFVGLVAQSRGLKSDLAEKLAQGRVYTGAQALSLQLVDDLGGVDVAQRLARELAKLPVDAPLYWFDETPSTFRAWVERMMLQLEARLLSDGMLARFVSRHKEETEALMRWMSSDPSQPLAHSLVTSGL